MKKYYWTIYQTDKITDEQRQFLIPPAFHDIKTLILISIDIDEDNMDSIVLGEITPENMRQAAIICKALNDANALPNPI